MSVVSGLAVLLLSVTINILAMIYCVYQLRGKLTQCHCVSGGDGDNVDQMYEQVDEKQHHTGAVAMKRNEAYGQLTSTCHNRSSWSLLQQLYSCHVSILRSL